MPLRCHGVISFCLVIFSFLQTLFLAPVIAVEAVQRRAGHCLALNLYWEARSEGREGMIAVGWVVLNRVKHAEFPDTVCAVIRQGGETQPCAWSWWCDGKSDQPRNTEVWTRAQRLARRLLGNPPPDPTRGALWFHHVSVKKPAWARHYKRTIRIGKHIFYRK